MNSEEILFLKSLNSEVEESLEGYDVKKVLYLANRQNVLPLCYENLSKAPGFDEAKYESIKMKVFSTVLSQTKRGANFEKIYRVILNSGIKPLVLKGLICRNLYGDLCDHRPSGDEDILVKKEDYFKLCKILEENGYIPEEMVTKKTLEGIQEITFRNSNGLNIEVHLNIIGTENSLRRKMNKYFDNVFSSSVSVNIGDQDYYTLGYTEHYIYLFYHMFKHFSMTGVGVRQILDMLKFGDAYRDKIDFDRVYKAVEEIGASKLYGDIIEIGNEYLGFSNVNVFSVTFPERLLEDMISSGAYGNHSSEQTGSKVKVMAALDAGGKVSRLRMLFPSMNSMREFYTVLYNHPYLLPVMWLVRIVRYIFRSKTGRTYDVTKSEHIADAKIQLLRDYGIIKS